MPDPRPEVHRIPEDQRARLAHAVMRRQASLSLRVTAIFVVMLFGLPLVNDFMPHLANASVMGFTLSWLFLGVLFYPITWLLSSYFIRESNRIEAECADWRSVLGFEAGEPLEPQGVDDVKPAFVEADVEAQQEGGR
jgi:uncharacterized membrane protein (DUF485 family)